MKSELPKLIVLLGPTASGKTEWGLWLAKAWNGEIISADSRQVYRGMDIGAAKEKDFQGVPHHLIDFLDPGEIFTAAEFHDRALSLIGEISSRGRVPFLVGGTGLYISAVVNNWAIPPVAANANIRKGLEAKGADELQRLLARLDPEAMEFVDPRNRRRVIRALEVIILSGTPFSAQRVKGEPAVNALRIGISAPRELLYARINERVDRMMARGLPEEVKALVERKYGWNLSSMSGIGYREFRPYFEGRAGLVEVAEAIKKDTRRFARRQMTWFRRDERTIWVERREEADALVREFLI